MYGIYQHQITVSRLSDSTGGRRVYASVGGEIACSIQPISDTTAAATNYDMQKTYKIYIPKQDEDIKTTDRLEDQDANHYTVKGVKKFEYANGVAHIEVTAELV